MAFALQCKCNLFSSSLVRTSTGLKIPLNSLPQNLDGEISNEF